MKICVIIPAYNEAKTIAELIQQVKRLELDVVVIDDGSHDQTTRISRDAGAEVIRNSTNKGKGASLVRGFSYCLRNKYDAVIVMDADGQHLPSDIPYFVTLAKYSNTGIIIGNRMGKAKDMPLLRYLTNKFTSWLISEIAGQRIPDTQCGFRLIKKEVLEKIALKTSNYETESEMLIKAAHLGFKIESCPIKTIYMNKKSHIRPFRDTMRFIIFVIREIWTMPH